MIQVKQRRADVPDALQHLRTAASFDAGDALADELPYLRFAVGSFDSWLQLRHALEDLRRRGLTLDSLNCLALEGVLAGNQIVADSDKPMAIQKLAFPDNRRPICCTSGPLAHCLMERLASGARSLKDALGLWLVPRHAAHFQHTVDAGKIILWVRLTDADNERNVCQSLLATSSNSVGVHDLGAAAGTASHSR